MINKEKQNKDYFRTEFSESIFNYKYKHEGAENWGELSKTLVTDVCRDYLSEEEKNQLIEMHSNMEYIAGGRYLYYAGRPYKAFNNCYLLRAEEDTREQWSAVTWRAMSCLMTGGGIGIDYSILRPEGEKLNRTGGVASGPIPLMYSINEIGRNVMQGGSRRSAIYGSLNWLHKDAYKFLHIKDWYNIPVNGTEKSIGELKEADFNYPAPLDMTNISLNYDNKFLEELEKGNLPTTFIDNVRQALKTGEPGFSFNFGDKENETLRNACTEVTSEDDSDVCNLASINMANIDTLERFKEVVRLSIKFLLCGTLVADLPYTKVEEVRAKNRRLGLGLMGVHEWLLKRGYKYEVVPELHDWLRAYKEISEQSANELAEKLNISYPVAYRAIAPTGTIGIMAGTTTGIEPLFAVAYKRRYLKGQKDWHYQYVIDGTAKILIQKFGIKPEHIESALDLAKDPERRIKFQADIQDYVDMSISSTINIPKWGSELNNDTKVLDFAKTLAKYAPRLRGFTCYPDGARGGQPLTSVTYQEAYEHEGKEFQETFHDICDISGGGTCGV